MIEAVGVVVPAHNEEDLLSSCLAAVRQAARPVAPVPVHVIVVADSVHRPDRGTRGLLRGHRAADPGPLRRRGAGRGHVAGAPAGLASGPGHRLAGHHGRRHDRPPGLAQQAAPARRHWLGRGGRDGHGHRLDRAPAAPACRCSASTTATGRGRTHTCTAPTSASPHAPTSRPAGSRRSRLPRTTPWSPRSATPAAGSAQHRAERPHLGPAARPRSPRLQPPAVQPGRGRAGRNRVTVAR